MATLGLLPAIIWLTLKPEAVAAWVALGIFTLALALSLAEQAVCKWASRQPPCPRFLVDGLPVAGTFVWAALGADGIALLLAFGSLQMAGSGMAPTLENGERFLYSRHVDPDRLRPRAVIVYQLSEGSAWGQPGWLTTSRILAIPGDRLAVRGGKYVVNGREGPAVADTRPYAPVIRVPSEPDALTVPEDHYFIVQDNSVAGYDSQVLSWVERQRIVADRLFYMSGRGVLKPVE